MRPSLLLPLVVMVMGIVISVQALSAIYVLTYRSSNCAPNTLNATDALGYLDICNATDSSGARYTFNNLTTVTGHGTQVYVGMYIYRYGPCNTSSYDRLLYPLNLCVPCNYDPALFAPNPAWCDFGPSLCSNCSGLYTVPDRYPVPTMAPTTMSQVQTGLTCYQGVTNTSAYGGGSDVVVKSCASTYTECYSCFVPKGSGGGTSPADHMAYGCGNEGFVNLLETLGAQDCVTCTTSLCNTAAGLVLSLVLLLTGLVMSGAQ